MLSKRFAKLDTEMVNRINKAIKQLKYNHMLHDNHSDKLKSKEDKNSVAGLAKEDLNSLECDMVKLDRKNKILRKKLRTNLADRKELKFYIKELRDAWQLHKGDHRLHADLEQIEKENKECAKVSNMWYRGY